MGKVVNFSEVRFMESCLREGDIFGGDERFLVDCLNINDTCMVLGFDVVEKWGKW